MIDNIQLQLLCGGRTRCTPALWNKAADAIDACYKFYFPIAGEATLIIDNEAHPVSPGRVYFISGYHIDEQSCAAPWEVNWIHFAPESLQLTWLLSQLPPFYAWQPETPVSSHAVDSIHRYFSTFTESGGYDYLCRHVAARCEVQGLLLPLLADLIEQFVPTTSSENDALLKRLQPTVDFIHRQLHHRITLTDMAAQAHMAPNYFHRVFSQTFNMTPLDYVTRRRLESARQLLTSTALPIREVGEKVGYPNEFYFSRVFKKHVKISPSQYRQQRGSL